MIADRYPTPDADEAFGRKAQIQHWTAITRAYAIHAANENNDYAAAKNIAKIIPPTPEDVARVEVHTGHEVVAFLYCLEEQYPEEARYLHQGLTSSDLVEYALTNGLEGHARATRIVISQLQSALRALPDVKRLARTHGQVGYLTNLRSEFGVTDEVLQSLATQLRLFPRVLKAPGPTGVYSPVQFRGFSVGADLDRRVVPATQVIHRDHLLAWATIYLRLACALENLALQVRLGARSDVGEFAEGAAASRAGSSAMPHKRNPIASEKVCGLARVARGHFLTIAEGVALWESRDLSNSSAERVAVPGLAGTVEHMLVTMVEVMENLQVDKLQMAQNIEDHEEHGSYLAQYVNQTVFRMGPVEASQFVRESMILRGNRAPSLKTGIRVNQIKAKAATEAWNQIYPD